MSEADDASDPIGARVQLQWGVKIPLRDGVRLSASLYLPNKKAAPYPCLFAMTPYTAQRNHLRASYLAAHGYAFVSVDVRGRGNSGGTFRPFAQEADDARDVLNWIAGQPFCNGKVAMFSGSYEGYVQWVVAKERPAALVTIAPGMAAAPGVDFPMRNNVAFCYLMQWLTYVADRTLQEQIFLDQDYWRGKFREWFESGRPFRELDACVGHPSPLFQEWLSHAMQGGYWDTFNPTADQFAALDLPILTLTGSYDGDQPGALHYYREHLRHAVPAAIAKHYLVIGPWDHGSTYLPRAEFAGLRVGPAALLDVLKLHRQWYDWTMTGGPKPEFLRDRVAYYVMGAERWRYAPTLDAVTARSAAFYLHSSANPSDVFTAGSLTSDRPTRAEPDRYVYDPRDVSLAKLESTVDPHSKTDDRMVYARAGKHLVYHSAPFERPTEISGFFKLTAWLAIDQPDTDFRATVYEVALDGSATQLSADWIRARHRRGLREQQLITSAAPLRYDFEHFTFISRQIGRGHRLRLVIGPIDSIFSEKNYNSGGVVATESMQDARTVTVTLFHDEPRPSALYVPFGQTET